MGPQAEAHRARGLLFPVRVGLPDHQGLGARLGHAGVGRSVRAELGGEHLPQVDLVQRALGRVEGRRYHHRHAQVEAPRRLHDAVEEAELLRLDDLHPATRLTR